MPTYTTPIRDMQFVYNELLNPEEIQALPGYEECSPDMIAAVLEAAGSFCEEKVQPLNRIGDEEQCSFDEGIVKAPPGFKAVYDEYCGLGLNNITSPTEYGGQGMPIVLGTMVEEIVSATCPAFGTYPGLTHGAMNAIEASASEELKNIYLPKMTTGQWSGTMCLTEPHCGTDLGMCRTKAEPNDDGSWKLSGQKIFISSGDHDLAENIIHLVLARTPGAPEGIKGISLFLVPKIQVKNDGNIGDPNGVTCGAIEHKMGYHGSTTCVINFDDAEGYMVGTQHKGMKAMFIMMNTARLGVAIQGLGAGEAARQGSVEYAKDRIQGRALTGAKNPDKPADPLTVHPDVRRMLLTQRAITEGNRAFAYWVSTELDHANKNPDEKRRQQADDFVSLMTPITKAFMTDMGSELANMGVQIYGGHGYIREWGMEQIVRDVRISQIYEGTNGVQALDLVGRKLGMHMGRYLRGFFHPVDAYLEETKENEALAPFHGALAKSFGRLQRATGFIVQKGMADPNEAGAASSDYLRLFALVTLAYLWMRMAEISMAKLGQGDDLFYQAKIDTARFYFERILPDSGALFGKILAGGESMMNFNDDAF